MMMVSIFFLFFFFLSCHFLFFSLNVFLNADGLVTECVCGIFHIDDDDVFAFYAFQELFKKISHRRTQAYLVILIILIFLF